MVSKTKQTDIVKSILIGRCECDSVLKFPFFWAEKVILQAAKEGYQVVDLKRDNFCEEQFNKYMTHLKPSFVFLNGHGDEFCAKGYQERPVLSANKNDHLLKDKVTHIISCKTGLYLAQCAIDKGCKGYIGYNDLFKFYWSNSDPTQDEIAKIFEEPVNVVSSALISGESLKNAYLKGQKSYKQKIDECTKLFFSSSDKDRTRQLIGDIIAALLSNMKHQVYLSS